MPKYGGTFTQSTHGESSFAVPIGGIIPFAGPLANIPTGFLHCNGAGVLRADFPQLFAVIGSAHGNGTQNGNGAATGLLAADAFNIPNYRGTFLRGVNDTQTWDTFRGDPRNASRSASRVGGNAGNAVGSVQDDRFQGHSMGSGGTPDSFGSPQRLSATTVTNLHAAPAFGGYSGKKGLGGSFGFNGAWGADNVYKPVADDVGNGTPRYTVETQPSNAYVYFLIRAF